MHAELNDRLDDVFGGEAPEVEAPAPAPHAALPVLDARLQKAAEVGGLFFEPCARCNGSGRFGRFGRCFACQGKGKKAFKTSAATRAQNRASTAARKERVAQEAVEAFAKAHPEAHAFMVEAAPTFPFAASMLEALTKWGDLTERQLAAVEKCVASRKARAAERQAVKAAAPVVSVEKIEEAFERARAKAARPGQMGVWVKPLRLTAGEVSLTVREGSAGSQWEGMLFVKNHDGKKLGHVKAGKFVRRRECTDAEQAAVLQACSDPKAAAIAFGKAWSLCSVCGRGLTNDGSIEMGIGPVCAEKFGW